MSSVAASVGTEDSAGPDGVSTGRDDPSAGRAAPMSRDDRRAAIVAATLPLLREHGSAVTTKQIAEASGIGEGTIFRVFTDKAELVDACLAAAFDQTDTVAQLAAIDRSQPLEPRLTEAVGVLQRRLLSVVELMLALGLPRPPDSPSRTDPRANWGHDQLMVALIALLEPDAGRLRSSAAETARVIRLLTFAASHPKITDEEPMSPDQIVALLLHGILHTEGGPAC
ncbi:MAG TPA: TetR/AcrR family transcriptional regulator [Jatrophihabitans sp.]|jgi:AcrR family transcriptional regulator|nr:TetR/AcrR family transcriptional regulator [Jatrophihabitans sp.]